MPDARSRNATAPAAHAPGATGRFTIGAKGVVTLGAPTVFDTSGVDRYHF